MSFPILSSSTAQVLLFLLYSFSLFFSNTPNMAVVPSEPMVAGRSTCFVSQEALLGHAKQGNLKPAELARVLTAGNFPPETKAILPEKNVYADWRKEGWVCMFEYPFRIGHTLPFSPLVRSFLTTFGYAPSQIMPTAWRILLQFDKIGVKHSIPVALEDVMHSYSVYIGGGERISLKIKDGMEVVILNASANDRQWATKFFFVEIDSLGPDCSGLFLDTWKLKGTF